MDVKVLLDIPPWDWPSDAGKIFRKVLMNSRASESDRLAAADLAGDSPVIDDHLANALLVVLSNANEPAQLRATAAISLGPVLELAETGDFEDPDDVPISESTFFKIRDSLQKLYMDDSIPKLVRRRILEAAVRSPEDWQRDAIKHAYASGDKEWMLTAVFSMRRVRGFDGEILASLESDDPEIHFEAVAAAGNWQLDAAWSHVVELVKDARTPESLLLVAIAAVGSIRPAEARRILAELTDSDDEEIAEAAEEAILMAQGALSAEEDDEEDEEDELIN